MPPSDLPPSDMNDSKPSHSSPQFQQPLVQQPLSRAAWEALAEPFTPEAITYTTSTLNTDKTHAIVEFMPKYWAVIDRLNDVLGPSGYSYRLETSHDGRRVTCHLQIGGVWRTGFDYPKLRVPQGYAALVLAAQRFHIGWQAQFTGRVLVELPIDMENLPDRILRQLSGEDFVSPLPWTHDGDAA